MSNPALVVRDVPGFPSYLVSNYGDVWKSWEDPRRQVVGVRTLARDISDGYPRVQLRNTDGVWKNRYVHQLVLLAFVGPCPPGKESGHRNGQRDDPRLDNLRYVTELENKADYLVHGTRLMGNTHPNRAIDTDIARAIDTRLREVSSYKQVADEFGVTVSLVSQIAIGKNWRHVFPEDWVPPAKPRMTEQQRAEAVAMYKSGIKQSVIARSFGVTPSAISHLITKTEQKE